jgi:hypothetical protein
MKKSTILLSAFIVLLAVSCKKKDEDTQQTPTPTPTPTPTATITINDPDEGTMYMLGQAVNIDVDITADFEMHGYDVYLINETADDTVWTDGVHDHGEAFSITSSWTNDVTMHSDMMLKVVAEIDHDGNTTEKSVHFHCHPD